MVFSMSLIQNILIKILIKTFVGGDIMFMVAIFSGLIVGKRRNITQVPTHLQEFVLADLESLGLDGYGDPLVEK